MRLILSSIAATALALVVSAAPAPAPADVLATKALPARFAMYLITDESRANGLRIRYAPGNLLIDINAAAYGPSVDGVFTSSDGHISLDRAVHGPAAPPAPSDVWYLGFTEGVTQLRVDTAARQAQFGATVGDWVQDANGVLRIVNPAGDVLPNGLRLCGVGTSVYAFWWDSVPYLNCPEAQFKVVAL